MSILGRLKNGVTPVTVQQKVIAFDVLPESFEQMQALPEAALETPFQAAALAVCAL